MAIGKAFAQATHKEDYDRARACVIAAQRARKAFSVKWGGAEIDSSRFLAIAGRMISGRYEVHWFSYDSCPSGCGADDPQWSRQRCDAFVDLRTTCPSLLRKQRTKANEDLFFMCDEAFESKRRRHLEFLCMNPGEPQSCVPDPE